MRISDWSSDVCSTDLVRDRRVRDTLQFEERAFAEISGKIDIGIRQIGLAGRDEDRATDGVPHEEGALGTAKHLHALDIGERENRTGRPPEIDLVDIDIHARIGGRQIRSAERGGGTEWVRTYRTRGAP